jgi:hypothetical protein
LPPAQLEFSVSSFWEQYPRIGHHNAGHFKTMKINVKIDSYKWHIIMAFDFTYGKKDNSSDIAALQYSS